MDVYDSLVRVSKMDQREEDADTTLTIRDQRDGNAGAIKARGGTVGREFKALDNSGWSVWDSPAWTEALARVKRGESKGWAVAYDDRLGRNWRKAGRFFDEAEEAGAEILIATLPGVDYRTDDGRTMTGLLAVVAERQYLAARARGNRIADRTAIERGVANALAYGYVRNADEDGVKTLPEKDSKVAVPDRAAIFEGGPSRADVVQRIHRLRRDRWKVADIVAALNADGIPAPKGGLWVYSSVSSILRNPQYTGRVTLGKRKVEGAHEALVTPAELRVVKKMAKPLQRNGRMVAGIAGGVLQCSGCDGPLRVLGGERLSYGCRTERSTGNCLRPVTIRKTIADDFVESLVLDALANRKVGAVASTRRLAELRDDVRAAVAELDAFVAQTPATSRAYAIGLEPREDAVTKAEHVLADALTHADHAATMPKVSAWSQLDADERSRVARHLLARILVAPATARGGAARWHLKPILDRFSVVWADDDDASGVVG